MSITSEAKQEVARLIQHGQKIEAIKYLKETFNVSLLDAKNLVEAVASEIEAGTFKPAGYIYPSTQPRLSASIESSHTLVGEHRRTVEEMLRHAKKIEAVKFVKETFKISLRESLIVVETVEREINPNAVSAGAGCRGGVLKILGALFGLAGLMSLLMAAVIYYSNEKLITSGVQTKATVIRLAWDGETAAAVFQYSWKGEVIENVSSLYAKPPVYSIGETVVLYVNPENNTDFIVNSFTDRWLAFTILGGLGIIFGFVSYLWLKPRRRF